MLSSIYVASLMILILIWYDNVFYSPLSSKFTNSSINNKHLQSGLYLNKWFNIT